MRWLRLSTSVFGVMRACSKHSTIKCAHRRTHSCQNHTKSFKVVFFRSEWVENVFIWFRGTNETFISFVKFLFIYFLRTYTHQFIKHEILTNLHRNVCITAMSLFIVTYIEGWREKSNVSSHIFPTFATKTTEKQARRTCYTTSRMI